MRQSQAPLPVSYAWYLVRHADWFDSGMALQCSGRTGGVFSDDGDILGKIRDGDGLDTLIRMADEHRPRCEWAVRPGDEPERPEPAVQEGAEARLEWVAGSREGRSFAKLHRLDYNVWDAWLHPAHPEGETAGEEPPARLTRNGVSYEMALLAVSRAMGDAMPEEFAVSYRGDHPETGPHPQPVELPAGQRARSAPLPMSYARYLIRGDGLGLALHCSGRTGGVSRDNGTELKRLQDGDSLDTLIRWADEHRARCEWAVCPADEREHPELTAQKRAEVCLKGTWDWQASRNFAKLHRLDHNVWDAWLHPAHLEGHTVREEPPLLLTRNGVSYEMALAAVFRAMGDEMPEKLAVVYLYDWPQRDPLGALLPSPASPISRSSGHGAYRARAWRTAQTIQNTRICPQPDGIQNHKPATHNGALGRPGKDRVPAAPVDRWSRACGRLPGQAASGHGLRLASKQPGHGLGG